MEFGALDLEVDRWVALRTSARWEKKIAETLAVCGVPVFLPLIRKVTQYPNGRRSSDVPMFGGYVFCSEAHFVGNPKVPSTCRKQVAQILRPSDPNRLKQELSAIAEFLLDHELIQERLFGKLGDVVQIVAGPLTGTEGVIVGLKPNKKKMVLEISFLNVRMEVEVEQHVVKKT